MFDSVIFADSLGDGFLGLLLMICLATLAAKKLFRKFDDDGVVKRTAHDAAKKGAVALIHKYLKK